MLQRGSDGNGESNAQTEKARPKLALPETKPRMTAKFVPFPLCSDRDSYLSLSRLSPSTAISEGAVSLFFWRKGGAPKNNSQIVVFQSVDDRRFTFHFGQNENDDFASPFAAQNNKSKTSKSVFTRENRSSRQRKSRSRTSRTTAARKYRE